MPQRPRVRVFRAWPRTRSRAAGNAGRRWSACSTPWRSTSRDLSFYTTDYARGSGSDGTGSSEAKKDSDKKGSDGKDSAKAKSDKKDAGGEKAKASSSGD